MSNIRRGVRWPFRRLCNVAFFLASNLSPQAKYPYGTLHSMPHLYVVLKPSRVVSESTYKFPKQHDSFFGKVGSTSMKKLLHV